MNLFFVGWDLPRELIERGTAALQGMTKVYPQLDEKTLWRFGSESGPFAASIHHPDECGNVVLRRNPQRIVSLNCPSANDTGRHHREPKQGLFRVKRYDGVIPDRIAGSQHLSEPRE